MQAIRLIYEVSKDRDLRIKVPKEFGKKVEVILLPAPNDLSKEVMTNDEAFVATSFLSTIEDDPEEDAVWREYIQ